jgi:hypothetical protein
MNSSSRDVPSGCTDMPCATAGTFVAAVATTGASPTGAHADTAVAKQSNAFAELCLVLIRLRYRIGMGRKDIDVRACPAARLRMTDVARSTAHLALVALLLSGIGIARSTPPSPLEGAWAGILAGRTSSQRVVFHFSSTGSGQWKGTLVFPDASPTEQIAIEKVSLDQKGLHCEIKSLYATFEGTLTADGQSISGTWKMLWKALPLTLKLVTPEASESLAQ